MKRLLPLLLLLAACAAPAPSPATPAPAPAAATHTPRPTAAEPPAPAPTRAIGASAAEVEGLTVEFWHVWDGGRGALIEQFAAEFNAANPYGITVRAVRQPDLFGAVQGALLEGAPPDVAVAFAYHAAAWDSGGALADLTGYAADGEFGFTPQELADFYPRFWAQDAAGGRGIPFYRTAEVLYYNVTWARELGFASPPATPDDLRTQACAANAARRADADPANDATGGLMLTFEPGALAAWLYAFGGGIEPLVEGNFYGFDRPENEAAFAFLRGLLDENCAWVPGGRYPHEEFAARGGLLLPGTLGGYLPQVEAHASRGADEWALLPYPAVDGAPAALVSGAGLVVFESTPARQLAGWLFVRWLASAENMARWSEATGWFPARASAFGLLADFGGQHPRWGAAVSWLPEGKLLPALETWHAVQWVLGDAAQVLFAPLITMEDVPGLVEELQVMAEEVHGLNRP